MNKKILLIIPLVFLLGLLIATGFGKNTSHITQSLFDTVQIQNEDTGGPKEELHPLTIEALRKGEYPGSDIVIEQTLEPGSNYHPYIVSYKSDGLKIYALLTVPIGQKPEKGWPVVVFNHGYIPPTEYRTTERYIAYTDAFSRNGYILFRPDYRGHGNSEGSAAGGYGSNAYTIDILNAVSSIKKLKDPSAGSTSSLQASSGQVPSTVNSQMSIVNADAIGMWGHSMGGHVTLRNMVANKDVKAGVIWAGVVASYPDLIYNWRRTSMTPSVTPPLSGGRSSWRQSLISQYGTPEKNPTFWNSISANAYLSDISGSLQLHHGTADTSVPVAFSEKLNEQMKKAGKSVELYIYDGDDHNLANNLYTALERSVAFFDKYLK